MDWDDAYANGAHIPGAAAYPERWAAAAAAFRSEAGERLSRLAYGAGARNVIDLIRPVGEARGLAVFVHGGYWMRFSGSDWLHLARGALSRGWAVAMPTYTLCPAARISQITAETGSAIAMAAGEVPGPILLAGHSAGGHLVSRMVCRDTPLPAAVARRISHVLSLSGVHDLRPLLQTAMNETLGLDDAEAAAESPALKRPLDGVHLTCWVGAEERPEFLRQNALLANIWTGLGARTRAHEDAGRHHFDVIDGLAEPDSPLMRAWMDED